MSDPELFKYIVLAFVFLVVGVPALAIVFRKVGEWLYDKFRGRRRW